jgi:hypothetical protein
VLDFGLAKIDFLAKGEVYEASTLVQEQLANPGSTLGTAAYMSPEQARGEALNARTGPVFPGRRSLPDDYRQVTVFRRDLCRCYLGSEEARQSRQSCWIVRQLFHCCAHERCRTTDDFDMVTRFTEEQGAIWGMRKEVALRAAEAIYECLFFAHSRSVR